MRKYASAEERAAKKKTENDRPPFWFYRESIRTSVHGSHIVEAPSYVGMPSWECCLRCAIAVEAGRMRAATASIDITI